MPLVDDSAHFGIMPGSLSQPRVYGAKIVSLHPGNTAKGRPVIQGFVALFDHDTGQPVALVDGTAITALRTAAASGLATRLLARPDASSLGLLGCGVQASSHLEAMCTIRSIRSVRVWGRSHEQARAFAAAHASKVEGEIIAVRDAQAARHRLHVDCGEGAHPAR
jgi:ornithine cyclodeaminase/alanine dehydrogenase-like protein (mu-crystallin family)